MNLLNRLPTPKERVALVVGAVVLFLILEYFILGWFSEIPPRCRLLLGHLGNYLEFLAAIVGAFVFFWHKPFQNAEKSALDAKLHNEKIAAAYKLVQDRNDVDLSSIVDAANLIVTDATRQIEVARTYNRSATFSAYLAFFLLGVGCIFQILAQG